MAHELSSAGTEDLLRLVINSPGEEVFGKAVAELVFRYKNLVYAQAMFLFKGDESLAEDVFQDTFIRLFSWLREPQNRTPVRSFPGLLRTFARRAAVDLMRKRQEFRLFEADEPAWDSPEIQQFEDAYYAQQLLERLESRSRDVLYLAYFEQLSAPEIAKKLNLTPVNVRVLKYRAIEEIRRLQALDRIAEAFEPVM